MRKKSKHVRQRRTKYDSRVVAQQKFSFLILNENFQRDILLTRKLNVIPNEGFKSREEYENWYRKYPERNQYINQVIVIRKKAKGFSRQHNELFNKYFLYNKVSISDIPKRAAIFNSKAAGSPYEDRRYWIEIFPNTTEDDLNAAFDQFKTQANIDFQKTNKPSTVFERDMRIMELISLHVPEEKLIQVINKEYSKLSPYKTLKIKGLHDRMREIERKITASYI